MTLAIAQAVGYLVVAALLFLAGGAWFGRGPAKPLAPTYTPPGFGGYPAPGYGPGTTPPDYGAAAPGAAPPGAPPCRSSA